MVPHIGQLCAGVDNRLQWPGLRWWGLSPPGPPFQATSGSSSIASICSISMSTCPRQ